MKKNASLSDVFRLGQNESDPVECAETLDVMFASGTFEAETNKNPARTLGLISILGAAIIDRHDEILALQHDQPIAADSVADDFEAAIVSLEKSMHLNVPSQSLTLGPIAKMLFQRLLEEFLKALSGYFASPTA